MSSPARFQTTPFEKGSGELAEALAWLTDLGVRNDTSRFSSYKKILDDFNAGYTPEDLVRRGYTNSHLYNAMLESEELFRIYSAFKHTSSPGIVQRLKYLIQGPQAYVNENVSASSNRARNFGFELALMANASMNGLEIIESNTADIAFRFGSHSFLVECKRPQAILKALPRAKEAVKQLEQCYLNKSKPRTRGIVALDLSKALNPRCLMPRFGSKDALDYALSAAMKKLLVSMRANRPTVEDGRTIAILVRVRHVASLAIAPTPEPCVCEQIGISPFPHVTHLQDEMLRNLANHLTWPTSAA